MNKSFSRKRGEEKRLRIEGRQGCTVRGEVGSWTGAKPVPSDTKESREEEKEAEGKPRAKSDDVNVIYLEGKDISISMGGPVCPSGVSTSLHEFHSIERRSASSRESRGCNVSSSRDRVLLVGGPYI